MKERCAARVYTGARWDFTGHPCSKPGKHEHTTRDGRTFYLCGIHERMGISQLHLEIAGLEGK